MRLSKIFLCIVGVIGLAGVAWAAGTCCAPGTKFLCGDECCDHECSVSSDGKTKKCCPSSSDVVYYSATSASYECCTSGKLTTDKSKCCGDGETPATAENSSLCCSDTDKNNCKDPKTWDDSTCECKCSDTTDCPEGKTRNAETCECECSDTTDCPEGKTRNTETCECECPEDKPYLKREGDSGNESAPSICCPNVTDHNVFMQCCLDSKYAVRNDGKTYECCDDDEYVVSTGTEGGGLGCCPSSDMLYLNETLGCCPSNRFYILQDKDYCCTENEFSTGDSNVPCCPINTKITSGPEPDKSGCCPDDSNSYSYINNSCCLNTKVYQDNSGNYQCCDYTLDNGVCCARDSDGDRIGEDTDGNQTSECCDSKDDNDTCCRLLGTGAWSSSGGSNGFKDGYCCEFSTDDSQCCKLIDGPDYTWYMAKGCSGSSSQCGICCKDDTTEDSCCKTIHSDWPDAELCGSTCCEHGCDPNDSTKCAGCDPDNPGKDYNGNWTSECCDGVGRWMNDVCCSSSNEGKDVALNDDASCCVSPSSNAFCCEDAHLVPGTWLVDSEICCEITYTGRKFLSATSDGFVQDPVCCIGTYSNKYCCEEDIKGTWMGADDDFDANYCCLNNKVADTGNGKVCCDDDKFVIGEPGNQLCCEHETDVNVRQICCTSDKVTTDGNTCCNDDQTPATAANSSLCCSDTAKADCEADGDIWNSDDCTCTCPDDRPMRCNNLCHKGCDEGTGVTEDGVAKEWNESTCTCLCPEQYQTECGGRCHIGVCPDGSNKEWTNNCKCECSDGFVELTNGDCCESTKAYDSNSRCCAYTLDSGICCARDSNGNKTGKDIDGNWNQTCCSGVEGSVWVNDVCCKKDARQAEAIDGSIDTSCCPDGTTSNGDAGIYCCQDYENALTPGGTSFVDASGCCPSPYEAKSGEYCCDNQNHGYERVSAEAEPSYYKGCCPDDGIFSDQNACCSNPLKGYDYDNHEEQRCCPIDKPDLIGETGNKICCQSGRVYDNNTKCCDYDLDSGVCCARDGLGGRTGKDIDGNWNQSCCEGTWMNDVCCSSDHNGWTVGSGYGGTGEMDHRCCAEGDGSNNEYCCYSNGWSATWGNEGFIQACCDYAGSEWTATSTDGSGYCCNSEGRESDTQTINTTCCVDYLGGVISSDNTYCCKNDTGDGKTIEDGFSESCAYGTVEYPDDVTVG